MKLRKRNLTIGYLFIIGGILLLLNNLDLIYFDSDLLWGLAFITLGVAFLITYYRSSPKVGILIVGFTCLVIGVSIFLSTIRTIPDELIGTLFLWSFSGIFITIHFQKSEYWWAIIPGGLLFVIGGIVLLEAFHLITDERLWFVFFSGTSLIFWYLFLIKNEKNRLGWAKYPAITITIFSFFILSITWSSKITDILFPISIILLGIYLIMINFSKIRETKSNNLPH